MIFGVELLPVLVVTIINIILGWLYYSPFLLGKVWADEAQKGTSYGQKTCTECKPTAGQWVGMVVVSFVTAFVLAWLISIFNPFEWTDGALLAFVIWILVAAQHLSAVIWNQKPVKLYVIDVVWELISLVVMGSILAAWR